MVEKTPSLGGPFAGVKTCVRALCVAEGRLVVATSANEIYDFALDVASREAPRILRQLVDAPAGPVCAMDLHPGLKSSPSASECTHRSLW